MRPVGPSRRAGAILSAGLFSARTRALAPVVFFRQVALITAAALAPASGMCRRGGDGC